LLITRRDTGSDLPPLGTARGRDRTAARLSEIPEVTGPINVFVRKL
jgi:hypothetical protein